MRLRKGNEYNDMTVDTISRILKSLDEFYLGESLDVMNERLMNMERTWHLNVWHDVMNERLMNMERTWHLNVWHDASTLDNHGHIVITINTIYDKPVFLTI